MPSAFTTAVPLLAAVASAQVLPPSPLRVSLLPRLPETGVSSSVVALSSTATGRSSTLLTVIVTVAVELSPSASVIV